MVKQAQCLRANPKLIEFSQNSYWHRINTIDVGGICARTRAVAARPRITVAGKGKVEGS